MDNWNDRVKRDSAHIYEYMFREYTSGRKAGFSIGQLQQEFSKGQPRLARDRIYGALVYLSFVEGTVGLESSGPYDTLFYPLVGKAAEANVARAVGSQAASRSVERSYALISATAISGFGSSSNAIVALRLPDGQEKVQSALGLGPIEATQRAIEAILGRTIEAKYNLHILGDSSDASAEVRVELRSGERLIKGVGIYRDLIGAVGLALVEALNVETSMDTESASWSSKSTSESFDVSSFSLSPSATRLEKPWGHEILFSPPEAPYTSKVVHVHAGRRSSLQVHDTKVETYTLLRGRGYLVLEGPDSQLHDVWMEPSVGYHVTVGQQHRLCAAPDDDVELLVVSTPEAGTTFRLEDDYAQAGVMGASSGPSGLNRFLA